MGDLTKNISRHELKCKCCNCEFTILDHEQIIEIVQSACDYFAEKYNVERVKLIITSAARCNAHNKAIGSNDNSMHTRACAIDHKIFLPDGSQITTQEVADYYDEHVSMGDMGIGVYDTFTHIDDRSEKARW